MRVNLSPLKETKSFTLIELLIVITIIGILAVALVPRITQGPARARDTQRKTDLQAIALALESYYVDHLGYPLPGKVVPGDEGIPSSECLGSGGDLIDDQLNPYLPGKQMPTDPAEGAPLESCKTFYYYRVLPTDASSDTPSHYAIFADLENDQVTGPNYYCDLEYGSWLSDYELLKEYLVTQDPYCGDGGATENAYYVIYN